MEVEELVGEDSEGKGKTSTLTGLALEDVALVGVSIL